MSKIRPEYLLSCVVATDLSGKLGQPGLGTRRSKYLLAFISHPPLLRSVMGNVCHWRIVIGRMPPLWPRHQELLFVVNSRGKKNCLPATVYEGRRKSYLHCLFLKHSRKCCVFSRSALSWVGFEEWCVEVPWQSAAWACAALTALYSCVLCTTFL